MIKCKKCGFKYPSYGNGCWKCTPNLRPKSNQKKKKIGLRIVEDYQETNYGEPYEYLSNGMYIHPNDAWW